MAKQSLVTIKAQAAAIATALNAALGDTLLTGIAVDFKDPRHPIRKWAKWVSMNDAGVFSADDSYLDEAYADRNYTKGINTRDDKITNDPA